MQHTLKVLAFVDNGSEQVCPVFWKWILCVRKKKTFIKKVQIRWETGLFDNQIDDFDKQCHLFHTPKNTYLCTYLFYLLYLSNMGRWRGLGVWSSKFMWIFYRKSIKLFMSCFFAVCSKRAFVPVGNVGEFHWLYHKYILNRWETLYWYIINI